MFLQREGLKLWDKNIQKKNNWRRRENVAFAKKRAMWEPIVRHINISGNYMTLLSCSINLLFKFLVYKITSYRDVANTSLTPNWESVHQQSQTEVI